MMEGWSGRGSQATSGGSVVQQATLRPRFSAMHVIFGRRARQRAQEIGSVPECGGGFAHARINDCSSWQRRQASYLDSVDSWGS